MTAGSGSGRSAPTGELRSRSWPPVGPLDHPDCHSSRTDRAARATAIPGNLMFSICDPASHLTSSLGRANQADLARRPPTSPVTQRDSDFELGVAPDRRICAPACS
jgi:hypothetical protein